MTRIARSKLTRSRSVKHFLQPILIGSAALLAPLHAWAAPAGLPQLNSDPGAAYTIYLDFGGFAYTGNWSNDTPGTTPAYDDVAANGTFSAQDMSDIKAAWAGVAMQYSAFNINVTTVDPATAGLTDAQRQTFYANTPNMMHTIIGSALRNGGTTQWTGAAGISFEGTTTGTDTSANGQGHTNWVVTSGLGYSEVGNVHYIAQDATHENGHGLGLGHQSDFNGTMLVNDYGIGDNVAGSNDPTPPPNGVKRTTLGVSLGFRNAANGPRVGPMPSAMSSTGPGTYGSIMGDGNFAQRLAWRVGSTSDSPTGATQNDVGQIISTSSAAYATSQGRTGGVDLHLVNDGIGHSTATASTLGVLSGGALDFNINKGVIVPKSEMGPNPTGAANYTSDFFKFTLASASNITLTAHDGSELVTPGIRRRAARV